MRVFVLDKQKQPLMPCQPARARQLLQHGKAAVFRCHPFTIILKERTGGILQPIALNVDPGSKTTGIALVAEFEQSKAAISATRYAVGRVIANLIEDTRFWSGGRTKKNRTDQGYPKDHWIDAACVGQTGNDVRLSVENVLQVRAQGHGSRQMCRMDRYGFPRTSAKAKRSVHGFKTGDIVKAQVPKGRKQGTHIGRVAVRSSGSFNVTHTTTVQGISYRYCRKLHACDGYNYLNQKIAFDERGVREQLAA